MSERFFANPESILGTLARLFASEGAAREVAILAHSAPELIETGYDNWNGGQTFYTLYLNIPLALYTQIEKSADELEKKILERLQVLLKQHDNEHVTKVRIGPSVVEDPQWREKAVAWLSGQKVSNQGRVRSDNVAPLNVDGLLFRSQPEINLYRALKSMGISFAPLPVFVRGGETYQRLEPDFVVVRNGIAVVIEVDGDTVHTETPAEAHARTTMLLHEGVHIERVSASECDTQVKAKSCAERLIEIIERVKLSR
jgi:hypothetical protein